MNQTEHKMKMSLEQFEKWQCELDILNSVIDDLDSVFKNQSHDVHLMIFEIGKIHSHLQTSWADMNLIYDDVFEQNTFEHE